MKKLIAVGIAVLMAGPAIARDWRDVATEAVLKEKSVIDAMFTQRISLWVSMRDDGSRRDGFASYLCVVLHNSGMESGDFVVIRIWDAAAMAREKMVEIGKYECSKN